MELKIYRDYDQQALDAQYNCRAVVPDHTEIFARWASNGEDFRRTHVVRENVPYSRDDKQRLDFFPAHSSGRPLLIFIHGGYWQAQDKSEFSAIAAPYLVANINVALINYRLAPTVKMVDIVHDVQDAIVWLYRNSATFGFSAEGIFVSGHSAGGHLTALAAGTDWRKHGLPGDAVKAAFAISGLYDLEPIRLSYVNRTVGLTEEEVVAFSPILKETPYTVPMILAVGGDESAEYFRLQSSFASRIRKDGGYLEVVDLVRGHHYDALDALGECDSAICKSIMANIARLST